MEWMHSKSPYFFFIYLFFMLWCTYPTMGIKCWFCNSMLDPYCMDPFDNSTATPKDCSIAEELPHLRGIPANMCRKIRMKVMGQWRFKRDCARLGEPGIGGDERYCIYRTGTYNIHMEYCTCDDKDGCNRAPSQFSRSPFNFLAVLPLTSLLFYASVF